MSMAFPTVLAAVQTEWGLSNRAAGSISSASQAGTALSLVVLSAMADYWGPRAVFLVSSAVAAVVALFLPLLAQGQASAVLLFFVLAVVVAGSYTPGLMLIASRFAPGRRGGAVGWFLASSSVGYVLALAVGGWVVATAGWRAALGALALGPLLASSSRSRSFAGGGRAMPPPPRRASAWTPDSAAIARGNSSWPATSSTPGSFWACGHGRPPSWPPSSSRTAPRRSARRGWGRGSPRCST